jgi:hypothetical protein
MLYSCLFHQFACVALFSLFIMFMSKRVSSPEGGGGGEWGGEGASGLRNGEGLLVPRLHVGNEVHHAARVAELVVIPVTKTKT